MGANPIPRYQDAWSRLKPAAFLVAAIVVIALSAFALQHVWRENGLRALQAINEPRIELIASAVRAEVNRQDHLPIVLSLDADVRHGAGGARRTAQARAM